MAVDISPRFIAAARERHRAANLRFELLDLLGDSPHALGQFDFVCGNGILHHLVRRLPEVLRALHGLTTPGGGLAFIEPNLLNPYCAAIFGTALGRRLARLEPDEMAFTPGQLRCALAEAGWRGVEVTTRDFLLPGLPDRLARPILAWNQRSRRRCLRVGSPSRISPPHEPERQDDGLPAPAER